MTASTTPGHQEVAERARQLAVEALAGSIDRKAAGCLVVILASSKTLAGARKLLPEVPLADVRQAVGELLDRLTEKEPDPRESGPATRKRMP